MTGTSLSSIRTFSGALDLARPRADDIRIADIARGLAHTGPLLGQTTRPYSHAEHALLVADLVALRAPGRRDLVEAALHHDDFKVYAGDIPRLIRALIGGEQRHQQLVADINEAIAAAVGFAPDLFADSVLREANRQARLLEHAHLTGGPLRDEVLGGQPLPSVPPGIIWHGGLDSETARLEWLRRANDLRSFDISPIL